MSMKFHRDQYVIALYGAVIVLALVLFPEWIAVHPSTDLTMSLGHGWILSPPTPLENAAGMQIERSWSGHLFPASIAVATAFALVAFYPRNAKPK
jgi:hypothetical protein